MAQRENPKLELRVADETLTELRGTQVGWVFPDLLILIVKWKSFIVKFVGAAALLAVILSLLLPTTFTATTRILPPQQNQSMATTAVLSQLGPLASLASQGLGLRTPSDLYVGMLRSDNVANGLISRFSLKDIYRKKFDVDTRHKLEGLTEITSEKSGVISISVSDAQSYWFSSPQIVNSSRERAAALANGYAEQLARVTKTVAVTEASQRRAFFEREKEMASDDLAAAEVALKQTQEKTGLILLDPQSRAIIEEVEGLRAQIASQEVAVQSMSSFATPENPDLVRAQNELAALRKQLQTLDKGDQKNSVLDLPIERVPTAGLEYIRKLREVKYREALFELLAKQYEAAKVDEARDAMIVQQLDVATPPERRSAPHRTIIVLSIAIGAFLIAILIVFYREALEQAKDDEMFRTRLQLFKSYLGSRSGRRSPS